MTSPRKPLFLDLAKRKLGHPESREDATRRMVADEDSWPAWPRLPLKRTRDGQTEIGCLVSGSYSPESGRVLVFLANIFGPISQDTPSLSYDSIDELVGPGGWVVD